MANIATFKDVKGKKGKNDDDKQEYFTGGGENSGLAVEGRGNGNSNHPDDQLGALFGKAEKVNKPSKEDQLSSAGSVFSSGGGNRLGNQHTPSYDMANAYEQAGQGIDPQLGNNTQKEPVPVFITRYNNGYTVHAETDDLEEEPAELRDPESQESKTFFSLLENRQVPPELQKYCGSNMQLDVMLVEKKEDYVKPEPKFKSFSGSGYSMTSSTTSTTSVSDQMQLDESSTGLIEVNQDEPSTTIQLRIGDDRVEVECNLSHTVGDLYAYAVGATGGSVDILNTFPRKKLTEMNQTIEAAGLEDAALIVQIN